MNVFGDCNNKTDEELVELSLKNQDFFSCLIKRYEERLKRYIIRISGFSMEDAEDLVQEVFIKVYENLNDFDPKLKFSSWIYRISHNQTVSYFRKVKKREILIDSEYYNELINNISSDESFEREIDLKDSRQKINAVLKKMDLKYREVLILKYIEQKSYKEISDIVKKPIGTVATQINRAKKQFREKMTENNIKI